MALRAGLLITLLASVAFFGTGHATGAELTLSWVDPSNGAAWTWIERWTDGDPAFAVIAEVPPGVTVYVDRSVSPGTTYCYRVLAYAAFGASPFTGYACATSPAEGLSVTVRKAGGGAGTVASAPAGVRCGTVCSATYAAGAFVTLTATPASGSGFDGWSGGGCTGTGPCVVSGNAAVAVTAGFSRALPSLAVTPSTGPPGTEFTVTLTNWTGGSQDWLSLAPAVAVNTTSRAATYVSTLPGTGGTRTWRVTLNAPGTFEVRLFLSNGFTRAATSPTFSVVAPAIEPTISVSPTAASAGREFIVTVTNWSGGPLDWLTIAPAGVGNTAYGPWIYVSTLQAEQITGTRTWRVTTFNALGTFEARLFLANSFTRVATSPTFVVPSVGSGTSP